MFKVSKKKIAVIGVKGLPAFGGSARANEEIIRRLQKNYDFTIYLIDKSTNADLIIGDYNVIVIKSLRSKRFKTLIYYLKACTHALIKGNYDLIHVNHLYSGFIVPLLRIRYKVLGTVRGIIPKDDNKWSRLDIKLFRVFEYLFCRFSSHLVSVSYPHIEYLKDIFDRNVEYIPNGVNIIEDVAYFKKVPQQGFILFSAARIISLKGAHILLEALTEINYKGKVIIIGNLDHVPEYKKKILNLADGLDVNFVDLIKDKQVLFSYIYHAKLFVFPSFNEGLSNMLLEVGAVGTPIICSDIPENKAIFNESEVLFFKTGDSSDLAEKIKYALTNPYVIKRKSEAAFKKLLTDFSWKDIALQYSNLYDSLLKEN